MRIEEALLDDNLKTRWVNTSHVTISIFVKSVGNAERSNQPIIENTRNELFATNCRHCLLDRQWTWVSDFNHCQHVIFGEKKNEIK